MSDDKHDEKLNRRQFFQRAAVMGAVVVGAGSVLAACKKQGGGGGQQTGGTQPSGEQGGAKPSGGAQKAGGGEQAGGGGAQKAGGGLDCTDTSGLKPQQVGVRKSLKYVDKSTKPNAQCSGCRFFQAPAKAGTCGSCQVVPGPINPNGWCTSYTAKS